MGIEVKRPEFWNINEGISSHVRNEERGNCHFEDHLPSKPRAAAAERNTKCFCRVSTRKDVNFSKLEYTTLKFSVTACTFASELVLGNVKVGQKLREENQRKYQVPENFRIKQNVVSLILYAIFQSSRYVSVPKKKKGRPNWIPCCGECSSPQEMFFAPCDIICGLSRDLWDCRGKDQDGWFVTRLLTLTFIVFMGWGGSRGMKRGAYGSTHAWRDRDVTIGSP